MKAGASPRITLAVRAGRCDGRRPGLMLHVGLDLSRTRLDVHAMDETGAPIAVTTAAPDAGGLASLAYRLAEFGQPVTAAIESMTGARFVHDQLELRGWAVEIADAVKVKGFAPLACKTDRIDAWVLAEFWRRDLVPAIWLPTPGVRADRERARWRLHLVRHRTALKNRIHATLMAFGHPCPVSIYSAPPAGGCSRAWHFPSRGPGT
jgi:transposase